MLSLTLRHPWAWAILNHGKRIENRKWKPSPHVLGTYLGLHGGTIPHGVDRLRAAEDLQWIVDRGLAPAVPLEETFLTGIVGVFRVTALVHENDPHPLVSDPWFAGPWGWVLSDVVRLPRPIAAPGRLGFWELSPRDVADIAKQFKEVMPCPRP